MSRRTLARLGAPAAAAAAVTFLVAAPASAHVTVTPTETAAGAYTVLTFSVGHGCEGSPTNKITIQVPEGINTVTPTRQPFYDVKVTKEKLAEPIKDAHGNELTERDATIVYTAKTPLPEGQRDAFEVSLQLPEKEGTLSFPTVQTCEKGETAWIEETPEGATEEPESPAPAFEVTAAESEDGHGHGHGAEEASEEKAEPVAAEAEDGDSNLWGGVGAGAGILGLIAGSTALALGRRKA
ncbi:YcnI family protein [Nocardioides sp. KC13]|uniref:YcnI family protein n=1 Tax=Nocardioides turkmenicus TaxID=2711220 RepID=A0A6M1R8P4_9ACTN|nr:YcnI family protein [Nocardioides sp. KC13]NGN93948.1 YcnI family protein [Nocardioides sp. KC13]